MLTLTQGWVLPLDDLLLLAYPAAAVAPTTLTATVVVGPQVNLAWDITGISGEDHYSILRRDATGGGSFAEVHTVTSGVDVWAVDAGPFTTGHRYGYRVDVVGGASDGLSTNVVLALGGTKRMVADEFSHT